MTINIKDGNNKIPIRKSIVDLKTIGANNPILLNRDLDTDNIDIDFDLTKNLKSNSLEFKKNEDGTLNIENTSSVSSNIDIINIYYDTNETIDAEQLYTDIQNSMNNGKIPIVKIRGNRFYYNFTPSIIERKKISGSELYLYTISRPELIKDNTSGYETIEYIYILIVRLNEVELYRTPLNYNEKIDLRVLI